MYKCGATTVISFRRRLFTPLVVCRTEVVDEFVVVADHVVRRAGQDRRNVREVPRPGGKSEEEQTPAPTTPRFRDAYGRLEIQRTICATSGGLRDMFGAGTQDKIQAARFDVTSFDSWANRIRSRQRRRKARARRC